MGDVKGQKKSRSARRGRTWKRTRKDSYKKIGFLFEALGATDQGCPSLGAFPSERWPLHGRLYRGNYLRATGAAVAPCPSCETGSQGDTDDRLDVRSVKRNAWLVTTSPWDNGWAGLGLNALGSFATIKKVLRLKVEHQWEGHVLKWLHSWFCHTRRDEMEAPVHQDDADWFLISLFLKKDLKIAGIALSTTTYWHGVWILEKSSFTQPLWITSFVTASFFNFGDTSTTVRVEIPLKALAWFTELSQNQVKQGHKRMVYYRFTNTERIFRTEL